MKEGLLHQLRCRQHQGKPDEMFIAAGIATPVARIKGEAYQVMQLLKKYNLNYSTLKTLLENLYGTKA